VTDNLLHDPIPWAVGVCGIVIVILLIYCALPFLRPPWTRWVNRRRRCQVDRWIARDRRRLLRAQRRDVP